MAATNSSSITLIQGIRIYTPRDKRILVLHIIIGILSVMVILLTGLSVFLIIQMRRQAGTIKVSAADFEGVGLPRPMTLGEARREESEGRREGREESGVKGKAVFEEERVLGPVVGVEE